MPGRFQLTTCVIEICPLSMTVGGCRLLSNEMAVARAGDFVREETATDFLLYSASINNNFVWKITRVFDSAHVENLKKFGALVVKKICCEDDQLYTRLP